MTNELTTQDSKKKLKSFIEFIERLEDQKADLAGRIREVFDEAKNFGFDPKIMKSVIKMRKMDESELEQQGYLTELYIDVLEAANV